MYAKNPDCQPGKAGGTNTEALENRATGGAQPLYGTGKYLDKYGRNCKLTNISFAKKDQGILGSDKNVNAETNNIPGKA